jgi:hypothetical protein
VTGYQVYMAVAEFFQHFCQYLEELLVGHVAGQTVLVSSVDLVPIEAVFLILIVEEAVFGVYDLPKRLEISLRGVLGYVLGDAGRKKEECQYDCHPDFIGGVVYHIFLFIRID